MMKVVILNIVSVFFVFCYASAKPVGLAKINAKIVSYDKNWIVASMSKKRFKVPRSVVGKERLMIGAQKELYLTQSQLFFVQTQFFKKKTRKK